jgi:hypothetical protein
VRLGSITEAVEALCVPLERAALVDLARVRAVLEVKHLAALGEYEALGLHEIDGHRSMKSWLRAEVDLPPAGAHSQARRASKLHSLPDVAAAVVDGRLSGGQLDVILARVPKRHVARFRSHCPQVVEDLSKLDTAGTAVAMDRWLQVADAEDPPPLPTEHESQAFLDDTIDGRGELRASMDADLNALVRKALEVADPKDFELPMPERRAAALGQICQTFLDCQTKDKGGRHRPHLNLVIDLDEFLRQDGLGGRYVDTDGPVSPEAMLKHICDASWHRLLGGDSTVLDYGRSTRDWPVNVWNAIAIRDGGCRWPGCDAPVAWCDVHHVDFWEHGGNTSVTNGVMLCRHHHTRTHKPGHTLKLLDDATVELTLPTGRFLTSEPRGPSPNRRTTRRTRRPPRAA